MSPGAIYRTELFVLCSIRIYSQTLNSVEIRLPVPRDLPSALRVTLVLES